MSGSPDSRMNQRKTCPHGAHIVLETHHKQRTVNSIYMFTSDKCQEETKSSSERGEPTSRKGRFGM